jgi:hypothetical protein
LCQQILGYRLSNFSILPQGNFISVFNGRFLFYSKLESALGSAPSNNVFKLHMTCTLTHQHNARRMKSDFKKVRKVAATGIQVKYFGLHAHPSALCLPGFGNVHSALRQIGKLHSSPLTYLFISKVNFLG